MDDIPLAAANRLLSIAADSSSQDAVALPLPPAIPRRGSALGRFVGRLCLSLSGWKIVGTFPDDPKLVIIVAPHTSNWDFIVGFSAYLALDLHASWFGKHTLFVWPLGPIFRRFGGIPVHRESRAVGAVVDVYADAFASRDRLLLAIAPEGTRQRVSEWKSGFHRIAYRAGVPIVPVGFDYRLRRIIVGGAISPSADREGDIARIKALYAGVTPRDPRQF